MFCECGISVYGGFILHSTPSVYTPLTTLSEEIEEKQVEETIKQALIKSSNLLPTEKETAVCVFPTTNTTVPMFTVGAGKIIVLYNKYYDDISIKAGIAHEYHHSVWTEKYLTDNASTTVLDNLIFEGKAVMFEKIAYPDITFTPIDERYHQEHWESIENDFHKADFNRSMEIISGGKGLPDLYGYSEGYKMVQSYLKLHPDLTPEEWTPIKALEIFNDGNYIDNYQ
ncbi:DUF2268 domain-containing putative Zn-dependent protease [Pontibacillus salipaludis]|uniref:DUF2268 domain-containing putative Zn-dependent protease n=1 Tax=Pontibacillus salipaludis TaxID=1697394 RepID=UPI003CD0AA68